MKMQRWTGGFCSVLAGLIVLGVVPVVSVQTVVAGEFVCNGGVATDSGWASNGGSASWADSGLWDEYEGDVIWKVLWVNAEAASTAGAKGWPGMHSQSTSSPPSWAEAYYEWEWEGGGTPLGGYLYYKLNLYPQYNYVWQYHATSGSGTVSTVADWELNLYCNDEYQLEYMLGQGANHLYGGAFSGETIADSDSDADWWLIDNLIYLWVTWSWQSGVFPEVDVDDWEYVPDYTPSFRYQVQVNVATAATAQAPEGPNYAVAQAHAEGEAFGSCRFVPLD
jgi:hypothetical protein